MTQVYSGCVNSCAAIATWVNGGVAVVFYCVGPVLRVSRYTPARGGRVASVELLQIQDFSRVLRGGPVELTALAVHGNRLFTAITDGKQHRVLVAQVGEVGIQSFIYTDIRPSGRVDKVVANAAGLALAAAAPGAGHVVELHYYISEDNYKTYQYNYRLPVRRFVDMLGYDDRFVVLDGGKLTFIKPDGCLAFYSLNNIFELETEFTGLCALSEAVLVGTEGGSLFRVTKSNCESDRHARAESREAHCIGLATAPGNSMRELGGMVYFYGAQAMLRIYDARLLDRVAKVDLMSARASLPLPEHAGERLRREMVRSGMSEVQARTQIANQEEAYAEVSDIVHMTMLNNNTALVVFRDAMILVVELDSVSPASSRMSFRVLAYTQSMAPVEAVFVRAGELVTLRTGKQPASVNLYLQDWSERSFSARLDIERPRTAIVCGNYAAFYIAREDICYTHNLRGMSDNTRAFIRVLALDHAAGQEQDFSLIELTFSEPLQCLCVGQPDPELPFLFFSRTPSGSFSHSDRICYCAKCHRNGPCYEKCEFSDRILALGCQKQDSYSVYAVVAPGAIFCINFGRKGAQATQLLSGLDIVRVYGFYVDTAGRFAILMCDLRGLPVPGSGQRTACRILVISLDEKTARILSVIPVLDFPAAADTDSYLFTIAYTSGTRNVAGLVACLGNVQRGTLDCYSVLTGEKVQNTLNLDFGDRGMLAGEIDDKVVVWTGKGKRVFVCPVSPPFPDATSGELVAAEGS